MSSSGSPQYNSYHDNVPNNRYYPISLINTNMRWNLFSVYLVGYLKVSGYCHRSGMFTFHKRPHQRDIKHVKASFTHRFSFCLKMSWMDSSRCCLHMSLKFVKKIKGVADKKGAKNGTCKIDLQVAQNRFHRVARQKNWEGRGEIFWWEKKKVFAILMSPTKGHV